MNNNSTSKTQELTGVSAGTRGLTNESNRWRTVRARRTSIRLLGKVVELDEWLDWRVKYGQRGAAMNLAMVILLFVLNDVFFSNENLPLFVVFTVLSVGFCICLGLIYYKNLSFAITRRLLKEVNVVVILVLAICIFIIDCVKPYNSFSPMNSFIYLIGVFFFAFIDAVKKKSRVFVLLVSVLATLITMWNIYDRTFNGSDAGVILFQYGDDYVFYKRSVQRACFLQILLFSLQGLWTMFKDKKMEMMVFATGNIYRETGTASKYVEDREHSVRMLNETTESMV